MMEKNKLIEVDQLSIATIGFGLLEKELREKGFEIKIVEIEK